MKSLEKYGETLRTASFGKVTYDLWISESRPEVLNTIMAAFTRSSIGGEIMYEGYHEAGETPEVYRVSAVALHKLLLHMVEPANAHEFSDSHFIELFPTLLELIQDSGADISYP